MYRLCREGEVCGGQASSCPLHDRHQQVSQARQYRTAVLAAWGRMHDGNCVHDMQLSLEAADHASCPSFHEVSLCVPTCTSLRPEFAADLQPWW